MGGVKGWKIVNKIYYMRKESIFNKTKINYKIETIISRQGLKDDSEEFKLYLETT